jgi:hypothetical protein
MTYLPRVEVHQQSLGDDENSGAGVNRIHPTRLQRAPGEMAEPIGRCKEMFAQADGIGQIHAQPPHTAVINTLALGFEALAERHHNAVRMVFEPVPQRVVDRRRTGCEGSRRFAETARKRIVDHCVNARALGVYQNAVVALGFHCAIVQRPQHRFGHVSQSGRYTGRSLNGVSSVIHVGGIPSSRHHLQVPPQAKQ